MRYMYLVLSSLEHASAAPPPRLMEEMDKLSRQQTHMQSSGGLMPINQAVRVRLKGGKLSVTDGPFAESKEFLAGYWIVDVESPQEAYDIAARASAAPGPGGKPMNMAIEVREVMSGPPPIE